MEMFTTVEEHICRQLAAGYRHQPDIAYVIKEHLPRAILLDCPSYST